MKKILIYIFGLVFVFLASKSLANSCTTNLKFCNDAQICIQATRAFGKADLANKVRLEPNRVWSSAPLYEHFVETAKQRGLDCGVIEIEEDCENNPSLCSPSDLCRKATKVSDDGKSRVWDINFKKHVNLAKIKKLQCSVVSKCGSDLSFCSADYICARALMPNTAQNAWSRSPKKQMYVRMAKKKSLHCGIKSEINLNCKSNPSNCSDEEICVLSTFNDGLHIRFDTNVWKMHAIEAVQRKLSCGINSKDLYKQEARVLSIKDQVNKRLQSSANSACVNNAKDCSDDELCKIAIKSNSKWDGDQPQYVWEAKQRGLNCGLPKTKSTTRVLCADSPKACSDKRLCEFLEMCPWCTNHELEANKRVLSCGSKKYTFKNEGLFSRKNFSSLSQLEKKQLQYALKNLGYYRSSIDGLYGPNTQKAVRAYAQNKGIKSGYPTSVLLQLKREVNVPSSFATAKRATNKSNNRSSNSSSSGAGQVLFRGLLGAAICSATSNPSGCMAGLAGQKPDYSSSGSENNFSYRSDSSCTRNADCGYREVCIKQYGKTRGTCMGVPSTARKGFNPNCNRDSDCVGSARCDRTYKVCVQR